MPDNNRFSNRWYALILASALGGLTVAMPEMCISVLFKEICEELNLNFVQVGTVWGIVPLGSVVFLLFGGGLCDRFGLKYTISIACFLAGIAGAMRGLSDGFASLIAFSLLFGTVSSIIPLGVMKVCAIWFPGKRLGLATGITFIGVGIARALASMISATFLSPLLGGWRNVLFLYGAISIALGIIWFITIKYPQDEGETKSETTVPLRRAIPRVLRIRAIWLIGFSLFAYAGGGMAIAGYLPLYLRENGWAAISADGVLTVFTLMSLIGIIPLVLLADKLGRRKIILVPAVLTAIICTSLLYIVSNAYVWLIVIILGAFQTAYISLSTTMVLETKKVGVAYSGTAIGLVFTIMRSGVFIASPLGNSLAIISLGTPFIFWASLFVCGAIILIFIKDTSYRERKPDNFSLQEITQT